jgi:hypothetical protein
MLIEQQGDPNLVVELKAEPTPEEIEDAEALALVNQDAQTAEAWIAGEQWSERWDEIDILYDSPRIFRQWENTQVMQPSIQRYIISRHVNSIHPAMQEGLFLDNPPFIASQRQGTDADTVRARSAVINYQLEDMEFENEVSNGLFQDILHGTGIWKWGMRWEEVPDRKLVRKQQPLRTVGPLGQSITVHSDESDEFVEKLETKRVLKPFFENREIRSIMVDPGLRLPDIRKAKYVIDKTFVNLADLLEMKKDPRYKGLPSEDEIRKWFETPKEQPAVEGVMDRISSGTPAIAGQGEPGDRETTEDPSLQGLPLVERTDKYKVITVLNSKIVIQNMANPYGVINYYSCNWFNRVRAFWGLGVGKIVAQDQRLNQGLTNGGLALLQLLLDPPYAVDEDANVATQNQRFRKGGFIKVKTKAGQAVRDAIQPLEMPKLPLGELMSFLSNSESEAEAADGANALTMQGSVPSGGGKSSITRTGTGVNAFQGATASRLQGPLDRFLNQVFIPWLYQLDELNTRFLPMNQVREIVGDELSDAVKVDEQKFKSSKMKFQALAATRMAARKVVAQSLPIISQIFAQPEFGQQIAIQGKYVDWLEIGKTWLQATGWPSQNDIFKDLTDEMKKNMMAMNPGVQKAQSQIANSQQKLQGQKELLNQKTEGGIVRDALNKSMDYSLEHELAHTDERASEPLLETGVEGGQFGG